jgi:NADP-dependent 3-hydroxy acid dehydrogenase YdfG
MASKLVAIIAGVGPGTGAAVARKFAAFYPVVLLARKPESYNEIVKEINGNGGKAIGVSTDVSDEKSVKNAIGQVEKEFGSGVTAAVSLELNSSMKCYRC